MPKFLAGCHYNEEEISRHLKKNIGYWPVQINGNKFATGQILEKPVEVVKGRILAGWAQKYPEPCDRLKNPSLDTAFCAWGYNFDREWPQGCHSLMESAQWSGIFFSIT